MTGDAADRSRRNTRLGAVVLVVLVVLVGTVGIGLVRGGSRPSGAPPLTWALRQLRDRLP